MTTTLGLLGLMHESHKNIIRGVYGVTPLTPSIRNLFEPIMKRGTKASTIDRCFGNMQCMLLMFPNKESNFTSQ
jgi:hypothetical protein